ncbi:hypothetical protein SAMN05421767_13517 [Granulicatella balaenopterae]|uniref:Uncharacterized protein n=1 Tax=Granulicatella balaenopterae TaxID=137733 RepID=A0A1H9N6C9_9LACT|nr:hypothetical protein [Granulicatella balaenopterae]SER31462.1 hypothetical protein SAMN05421767_13517 [Granulicatella balaenopterae]
MSKNPNSLRKIRNLFAHANLERLNLIQIEDGKTIYYPLVEDESCLIIYDKISEIVFNMLLSIIYEIKTADLDWNIQQVNLGIEEISVEKQYELLGFNEEDINKIKSVFSESEKRDGIASNNMWKMVHNSSNLNVLESIYAQMFKKELDNDIYRKE